MPKQYTRYNLPVEDRFWANVKKTDGCWLWVGSCGKNGYGRLSVHHAYLYAHRLSWEIHNGPIPDGLFVCHDCPDGDNPLCVNPAHLFLGTQTANMADMLKKGRNHRPAGELHPRAKLTALEVREIRARHARGDGSYRSLAKEYGVNRSTLGHIITLRTWKSVA